MYKVMIKKTDIIKQFIAMKVGSVMMQWVWHYKTYYLYMLPVYKEQFLI